MRVQGIVQFSLTEVSVSKDDRRKQCSATCSSLLYLDTLVHFDHAVDLSDEPETGEETDCTSEQKKDESHDHSVSKVKDGTGQSSDLQLGEEIMNGINQEVDSSEATGEEGAPLPVVVLST